MAYTVLLSDQSKKELVVIKNSGDKPTLKKIANLLVELQEHPRTGAGQVEHFAFEQPIVAGLQKLACGIHPLLLP